MTPEVKRPEELRRGLYRRAVMDSFAKLDPRWMVRNPVMFVVEVGSGWESVLFKITRHFLAVSYSCSVYADYYVANLHT